MEATKHTHMHADFYFHSFLKYYQKSFTSIKIIVMSGYHQGFCRILTSASHTHLCTAHHLFYFILFSSFIINQALYNTQISLLCNVLVQ